MNTQVGAAFAVLLTPGDQAPALELQAAKSRVLHTEPAAGTIGILSLLRRIQSWTGPRQMLQLRNINPHVVSAFQVVYPGSTKPCLCTKALPNMIIFFEGHLV